MSDAANQNSIDANAVAEGLVLGVLDLSIVLIDALTTSGALEPDGAAVAATLRHSLANTLMVRRAALEAPSVQHHPV